MDGDGTLLGWIRVDAGYISTSREIYVVSSVPETVYFHSVVLEQVIYRIGIVVAWLFVSQRDIQVAGNHQRAAYEQAELEAFFHIGKVEELRMKKRNLSVNLILILHS